MTKFLADLLSTDHPLFVKTITDFERASGNAGVDTRLIADITEKGHAIMRELGIDPSDTSGEELYHALNAAVGSGQAEVLLRDSHYVLLGFDNGPVSFCLHDVIENAHHELPYASRVVGHGQRHLRAEIIRRYAEHDRTSGEMIHELAEQAGLKPPEDEGHPTLLLAEHAVESSTEPRILAIGDIFTDAFIKLSEEVARVETDENGEKRLSLPFGSKPPYERADIVRAVGPSPNAAVAFARLGESASLLAWLGDDLPADEAITYLESEHVSTELIVKQPDTPSNYYYVLRLGAERTILVKNEAYRYEWVPPARTPDWIYLSLISADSWQLHEDLLHYLQDNPDIKLAFQPGTFHFKWGAEKLKGIYGRSHIVVMNREEAVDVTGKSYDSLPDLTSALHEMGPSIVVITDGPNGSYASFDGKLVTIPNYPDPAPPVDRTGAGDAFASTIVAALAKGESMETALTWAPINSMNVVQELGAQAGLLTEDKIQEYLRTAPEDYKVRSLE